MFGSLEEGRLTARVRGSRRPDYLCTLLTDPGTGAFIDAYCDCPYELGYCKHIAAALILSLQMDEPSLPEDPPQKPFEINLEEKQLEFDSLVLPSLKNLNRRDWSVPGPEGSSYELVFCLEEQKSFEFYEFDSLSLVPVGRYLKKDGKPGRIDMHAYRYINQPLPDEAERCIRAFSAYRNNPLLLSEWLHLLSSCPGIPWVYRRNRTYLTLSPEEAGHVSVGFTISGLSRGDVPVFQPEIAINGSAFAPPSGWLSCRTPRCGYWLNRESAEFYYTGKVDQRHEALQILLSSPQARFSTGDIQSLRDMLSPDFFSINFPYDKVVVSAPDPKPALELFFRDKSIRGRLFFEYDGEMMSLNEELGDFIPCGDAEGGDIRLIRRNPERERSLSTMIQRLTQRFIDPWVFTFDPSLFFDSQAENLLKAGVKLFTRDKDNHLRLLRGEDDWSIEVTSGIDWLDLKLSVGGIPVNWTSIDESGFCETGDEVLILKPAMLERLRNLQFQGESEGESLRVSSRNLSVVDDLDGMVINPEDPGLKRMRAALKRLSNLKMGKNPVPGLLTADLRPYQKLAFTWLDFLSEGGFGGILADDMGLGKTVQALSLMAKYIEKDPTSSFLVIAPVSTLGNWINEIRRFLPSADYNVHHGTGRASRPEALPDSGIVLTSYATLYRDIELLWEVHWQLVVFDESQALKNTRTKTYRSARSLRAEMFLALSGTPVENSLMELWGIMDILNPGLLGERSAFKRRYVTSAAGKKAGVPDSLKNRVRPFILRRKKEDVAPDLPEREEIEYSITMTPRQASFYQSQKEEGRARVQAILQGPEPWKALPQLLQVLTRLRQTAIDSSLTGGPSESAKLDSLADMLRDIVAEGNKALVFSQFVKVLGNIRRRLDAEGFRYAYLDGQTRRREEQINLFQDDPSCPLFLISLKAGGLGLNLTAADYVFIVDPWWNPAVERQAVDRAHRIGRTKKVIAYRMISENTIEERIKELQEQKKALAEDIFSEESSVLRHLTPDEILGLFS